MKNLLYYILPCLSISPLSAQLRDREVTLADGTYEVALDEVHQQAADGGVSQALMQGPQRSTKALVDQHSSLGRTSDLVLYRIGEKRSDVSRRILTRKILVKMKKGTSAQKIAKEVGARKFSEPEYAPGHVILEFAEMGDSLKMLPMARSLPGVLVAEPLTGRKRFKRFIPNDPLYSQSQSNISYQWHLNNTGANGGSPGEDANIESVWDRFKGAGVSIGIVDDGLEVNHPDLAANVNTAIDRDWNDSTPDDPTPTDPVDAHGTSCAGVAAGKGDNGIGISGAAPDATLVGLRLIAASVTDAEEAEAINWQNDLIQVKSNSWGPSDGGGPLNPAGPLVQAAYANSAANGRGGLGTIHMWAAGNGGANDNVNQDGYANSIYTVAIGSVTDTGAWAGYSEPGCAKLASAHSSGGGQSISTTTLVQNGSYTSDFGGTSSAAPLAAGIVALMLEANPNLGWRDVQEILMESARKTRPGNAGWIDNGAGFHFHHDFGAGVIDAAAAVALAETWVNLSAQASFDIERAGLGQAVPDNSAAGTTVEFDLSGQTNLRVEHVTLTLNLTHSTRGQLRISLISPSGTESFLSVPHDLSTADYDDWKMMTVFNWGEDSTGIWKLKVIDEVAGESGVINDATIEVFGAVPDPPVFVHAGTTSGNRDTPFSYSVRATNSATSYTALGLPPGLFLNVQSGLISGIPTTEGSFNVTLSATNSAGTSSGALNIVLGPRIPTPPAIRGLSSRIAIRGQAFAYQITATNNPTSFTATPLPSGISLSPSGLLSGIVTSTGTYAITLGVSNADGSDTETFTLQVVEPGFGPFAAALDNDELLFFSQNTPAWTAQTATFIFDNDALQSPPIGDLESTSFSTDLLGPGLVQFQWKVSSEEGYDNLQVSVDGLTSAAITGEIDWTDGFVMVPEGLHTLTWTYLKDDVMSAGQDRAWVDQVRFVAGDFTSTIGDALDYPGLAWQTSGDWVGQPFVTNDGVDALKAPNIGSDEETSLEVQVTGPGVFEFCYRYDTEAGFDFFNFTVDGIEEIMGSGFADWTNYSVTLPAGIHTLKWSYKKDEVVSVGSDTVWLDEMLWISDSATGFEQWTNLIYSPAEQADLTLGAATSDFDGDGRPNLLEYAFNTSPSEIDFVPEANLSLALPTIDFTYEADLSKTDIIYSVQESSDLVNWSDLAGQLVSTTGDLQTRRAVPTLTGDKVFLRVKIEQVP